MIYFKEAGGTDVSALRTAVSVSDYDVRAQAFPLCGLLPFAFIR